MDVSITNDETIRSAGDSAAKKIENERDFFEPSSKEHDLTKIDSNNLTDITLPEKNDEQLNEGKFIQQFFKIWKNVFFKGFFLINQINNIQAIKKQKKSYTLEVKQIPFPDKIIKKLT